MLNGFGKTLGYLDKELQMNAIKHTVGYIDGKIASLQLNCEKNKRMYLNLGVLGGLLLAVVLW
jgi:stage III sporulation protein AB